MDIIYQRLLVLLGVSIYFTFIAVSLASQGPSAAGDGGCKKRAPTVDVDYEKCLEDG
jgi:hypothetical protein